MVLEKGDVVLTGTPKGVGSVRGGDVITAGIRVRGKEEGKEGMVGGKKEAGEEGMVGGKEEGKEGMVGTVGGEDNWVEVPEGRVEVQVRDREGGWDWGVEE